MADEDIPNIDELLARTAPPAIPAASIAIASRIPRDVRRLDPIATTATLAGLQTDPTYQANTVRLDWATRLVLALSRGSERPTRAKLATLLNADLAQARVASLEDPIEDFFVEAIPTTRGDFLVFTGSWEKAASHTFAMLAAFQALPDDEAKELALEAAFALLRLSHAVVRRSGVARRYVGEGLPGRTVKLPLGNDLLSLAERVRFSWQELADLGIEDWHLAAFTLHESASEALLQEVPGNSPLEFHPLVAVPDGIVIVAPGNITTAVRALLITTATDGGMAEALRRRLLDEQAKLVRDSGFTRIMGRVQRLGTLLVRQSMEQISTGRFVHYVQSVDGFDNWPRTAFGGMASSDGLGRLIVEGVAQAKAHAEAQPEFVEGVTYCFIGGWGGGRALALDPDKLPADWPVVFIEPADAAVLGHCEDGSLIDIWRLHKQLAKVEAQGFEFIALNGVLNLFQWWRNTDHALVPPHLAEITPPTLINFGTDLLLQPRREGEGSLDRRALPYPDGSHKIVVRLDEKGFVGELEAIYGSVEAATQGVMLAALPTEGRVVWLTIDLSDRDDSEELYETWRAALHWLHHILPAFWLRYGSKIEARCVLVELSIDVHPDRNLVRVDDSVISAAVGVSTIDGVPRVSLRPEWSKALYRADNRAEVALAGGLLEALALGSEAAASRSDLELLAAEAVGSPDWRWRHAFEATHVVDVLTVHGLNGRMNSVPVSAGALLKCGMAWKTRSRDAGPRLEGADACGEFLIKDADASLGELRKEVSRFNRKSLAEASLRSIQAALAESRRWERTARATRAIHGQEEDYRGSLQRQIEINAVIRSSSILVEMANADAPYLGGRGVGTDDLGELQALAMQAFLTADLIGPMLGGWIKPQLHFSPTGDVLSDHEFEELTLRNASERRHSRDRAQSSESYAQLFERSAEPRSLGEAFAEAVAAEYGVDIDAYLDLPAATALLAGERGQGVFALRRIELIATLEGLDAMKGKRVAPLIDRMTLAPRNGSLEIPPGFVRADFDIARFDRRCSLIARPIVAMSFDDDPELLVAPSVIERALFHNILGAMGGSLQNAFWESKAMRTFASASAEKVGLEFNQRLAEAVATFGPKTWPSAKPAWCLNCKATPAVEALGDIDVLGVSSDGLKVWVVEAKDLKLCRTLGESARRLADYRGGLSESGKPDRLLRHLRRVSFIRSHASELVGRLKLPGVPEVHGVVVVRAPQPMENKPANLSADARVVMFDDLGTIPWQQGWPSDPKGSV
jgi:hypothetical protein